MAEPVSQCREALEGQAFKFKCPPNFYISSVVAYYGQPSGSCGCPYPQQVDSVNECQGTQGDVETTVNDKVVLTPACVPNTDSDSPYYGETKPCYSSLTRFGNRCCSLSYTDAATQIGDLGSLELAPNPTCNSLTAPYIAHALCDGLNSCSFNVTAAQTFTFDTSKLLKYGAGGTPTDVCSSISGTTCTTSFAYNAITSGCAAASYTSPTSTGYKSSKLMFEAICMIDTVTIGGGGFSTTLGDDYVVLVATTLNSISILVFILGVYWIQRKIDRAHDVAGRDACTASDYTVLCHTMPTKPDPTKEGKFVPCVTREEIKAHLTAFFQKQLFDPTYPIPVEIADINVTTGDDKYLDALVKRGEASSKVDEVIGAIQSRVRRGLWYKTHGMKQSRLSFNLSPHTSQDSDPTSSPERLPETSSYLAQLKSALMKFEIANDVVQERSKNAEHSLCKAYVTFTHEMNMARALQKYPNIGYFLTPLSQSKDISMNGQTVYIERAPEPEEIIFEHVPIPEWNRFIRFLIGTWMTILCLGISYAMIYEAKNIATMWQGNSDKVACSTFDVLVTKDVSKYTDAPTSTITYADVLYDYDPSFYKVNSSTHSWGSYNYLQCYCSQVAYDAKEAGADDPMAVMKAYQFYDARSGSFKEYCEMMLSGSTITMAANYIATFVIVLVNANLAFLMAFLVDFEKHVHQTGRIMSMMVKLFIAQYINTAFLSLIIAGR